MSFLAKRIGFSSTGYLSDIISGRRKISLKYQTKIAHGFNLSGNQSDYLKDLIRKDHEKINKKRLKIEERLKARKKSLLTRRIAAPKQKNSIFQALEVFCAFGLFKNSPSYFELRDYFSKISESELRDSLLTLKEIGLIKKDRHSDHYKLLADQVLFDEEQGGLSHIEFIKQSLLQATQQVPSWFSEKKRSSFVSSVISVDKDEYQRKLAEIKRSLTQFQSDLESHNANSLVRFNVQIFPIE